MDFSHPFKLDESPFSSLWLSGGIINILYKANSEDLNQMAHSEASHGDLHCLYKSPKIKDDIDL